MSEMRIRGICFNWKSKENLKKIMDKTEIIYQKKFKILVIKMLLRENWGWQTENFNKELENIKKELIRTEE